VILVAYLGTIGATLTAIASVVTPLGLSEEIRPGAVIKVTTFDYARDESLFGRKTQSRDDYVFSRTCGVYSNKTCPGGTNAFIWNNHQEYNWATNNTAYYSLFEIACNETFHSRNATAIIECLNDPIIFENVTAIDTSSLDTIQSRRKLYDPVVSKDVQRQFSSSADTDWDLRARAFDIEFRTYRTVPARNDSYLNTTGDFVTLESLLFEQGPQLREGLIIDPINGGIGFRNHTVPTEPSLRAYGAQWKEDILWIEPETFCSDTLLTYQQTSENTPATTPSYYFPESRMLIDRGAFFRTLNLTQPVINQSDPYSSPQLEARSLSAAIRFAAMIMQDLKVNINNSTVGQGHNLDQSKFGNMLPSQGLDYMYYGRFPLPSWCGDYEHNETSVCTEFESNIVCM
jgi:hypothetical protein